MSKLPLLKKYLALPTRLVKRVVSGAMVVMFLASPMVTYANPGGGVVVAGSASISSSGNKLDVHQHTHKAVIDWRTFNIAVDEHTQFHQPSSSAIVLNRVKSGVASSILGKLTANGNVIIVNPNGVFFGQGSVVDVNSIVATTSNISNAAFMADGPLNFTMPGDPAAAIINEGTITARDAGLVGLVAPNVVNNGVINARLGKVQLASGDTMALDFYGDGLYQIAVSDAVSSQLVANTGILSAAGGTVALTAAAGRDIVNSLISVEGELHAPTVAEAGGKIVIAAAGSNAVAGNNTSDKGVKSGDSGVLIGNALLNASGRNSGEQGGQIEVTADHIAVLDNTIIDASGHSAPTASPQNTTTGTASMSADGSVRTEADFLAHENRAGGSIKIGGDYLGTGDTATAKSVTVDQGAVFFNDALNSGDGGRTIVWSDDTTQFYGSVLGRGGLAGGNGGFLETSGKKYLDARGYADLTANSGYKKGTYLLDPADITIYGNVDPTFTSTDSSVDFGSTLQSWHDGADPTQVTLTYSTDSLSGATASGTSGTNTITTSADVSSNLAVGARIRLGGSGSVTTADTLGADTYTITNISGTTITVEETLTTTYAGGTLHRGLVSQISDKSGNSRHATQTLESDMPMWLSNGFNTQDSILFDGANDNFNINVPVSNETNVFTTFRNYGVTNSIDQLFSGNSSGGFWYAGTIFANRQAWHLGDWRNGSVDVDNGNPFISEHQLSSTGIRSWLNGDLDISHDTGTIVFDTGLYRIGEINSGTNERAFNGDIPEMFVLGGGSVSDTERNVINQYQAAKWGVDLTPPGTGANEAAQAMASDGYSAFTTRYLEKLSNTADIVLQADNSITLDLQGDTLALIDDRSITLQTTNGNIATASTGGITTNRTTTGGNVALNAGGDIDFDHAFTITANNGGDVNLTAGQDIDVNSLTVNGSGSKTLHMRADRSILLNNSTLAATAGQGLTTILNADADGDSDGAIDLTNTTITANTGEVILSGGDSTETAGSANDLAYLRATGRAVGNSTQVSGVELNNSDITVTDGNVTLRGQGYGSGNNNHGVYQHTGSQVTSTGTGANAGTITVNGTGGGGNNNNYGFYKHDHTTRIDSIDGDITITGQGGGNDRQNHGIYLIGGTIQSTGTGSNAANITLNGTSSGNNNENQGVLFSNDFINTIDGDVTITGTTTTTGNTANFGVTLERHRLTSTGTGSDAGNITIVGNSYGRGNNNRGVYGLSSTTHVQTVDGDISITGTSNATGTGTGNHGIMWFSDADITSTGVGSDAGNITLNGTGGGGSDTNYGTYISGTGTDITTTDGNISITGQGGNATGTDNYGVYHTGGSVIESTGTGANAGTITLNGTGGTGTSNNFGTYIHDTNTRIRSVDGDISVVGQGGNGSSSNNYGIRYYLGPWIESTGTGIYAADISLNGTGGSGSSAMGIRAEGNPNNIFSVDGDINITGQGSGSVLGYGLYLISSYIRTTGTGANAGNITINGTGGTGSTLQSGTVLNTSRYEVTDGDLTITGVGGTGGTNGNIGVDLTRPTLRSFGDGNISITGTGNGSGTGGHGIHGRVSGLTITAREGNIALNGTSNTTGADSYGVFLEDGGDITNTHTGADAGNITITGTSNGTASNNHGVYIREAGTTVSSIDGAISVTGQAGGSSGANNHGILISESAEVTSTGTGANAATITLNGTGGAGTTDNYGTYITGAGTTITSADGDVAINGTGGDGSGNNNHGIYHADGAVISSTGTTNDAAQITLTGKGGEGVANNYGGYFDGTGTTISSAYGDILVTGTGGGSNSNYSSGLNYGIYYASGALIQSTGTGAQAANIALNGTGYGQGTNNMGIQTAGTNNITAVDGDINITGQGGTSANFLNMGMYLLHGNTIATTGTGAHAGNININGTGGGNNREYSDGVYLNQNIIQTVDGDINITGNTGIAGAQSQGVEINRGRVQTTGTGADAGNITITGTSNGTASNNHGVYIREAGTTVSSIDGAISVTGQAGGSSGANNHGILISESAEVTSTGTGANAATITLNGTGGGGSSDNYGVSIIDSGTTIASADGDISITGQGGNSSGNDNYGIHLNSSSFINSTGTGTDAANITLNGSGGTGSSGSNGVRIINGGTNVRAIDGDISITGLGGNNTTSQGYGIYSNGTIRTTGTGVNAGNITLHGTGNGTSSSGQGKGIEFNGGIVRTVDGDIGITGIGNNSNSNKNQGVVNNGTIQTTGVGATAGNITINGTGNGSGNLNYGIQHHTNGNITTVDGDIALTGTSNNATTGTDNYGIWASDGADITSTGTGSNAGTITLNGTGGNGTTNNHGTYITGSGTTVTSADGNIAITGTGGDSSGTHNYGAHLSTGALLSSVNGDIGVTGTGGDGGGHDYGVNFNGGTIATTGTTSDAGNITLIGNGGGRANSNNGRGVAIFGNGTTLQTAYGNITITGTSNLDGKNNNHGIIADGNTIRSTNAGNINLTGYAYGTSASNRGVYILGNSAEFDTVNGNLDLTGVSYANNSHSNNYGVNITRNSKLQIHGSGALSITGQTASSNSSDINLGTGANGIGNGSTSGGITVNANTYSDAGKGFNTTGTLTLRPRTSAAVNVGTGTGGLDVSDTELGYITANKLVLGDLTTASGLTFAGGSSFSTDTEFLTAGDFNLNEYFDSSNTVLVRAGGDIILNEDFEVSSAASNALVLSAGGNFTNNNGSSALNVANSRWLVYSNGPTGNTRDGILPDASEFGKTYATDAPGTIGAGNRFIYATSTRPTLTYSVSNDTVEYGDAYTGTGSLTYTSGLLGGDTLTNIGLTGSANYNSTYNVGDNAGNYAGTLSATTGTLANPLGYQFALNNGDLTVTKAALTVSLVDNAPSRQANQANPNFDLAYIGFKLGENASVLDTAPTATSTLGSTPGTYAINGAGGSDNNYTFLFGNPLGQLTVTGIPLPPPSSDQNVNLPDTVQQVSQNTGGLTVQQFIIQTNNRRRQHQFTTSQNNPVASNETDTNADVLYTPLMPDTPSFNAGQNTFGGMIKVHPSLAKKLSLVSDYLITKRAKNTKKPSVMLTLLK